MIIFHDMLEAVESSQFVDIFDCYIFSGTLFICTCIKLRLFWCNFEMVLHFKVYDVI